MHTRWVRNGLWRGSFLSKFRYPRENQRHLFSLKSPCLRGFNGTFLASNVIQVTVISGWNDLYESMGTKGHVGHLALVIWPMPTPQWVPNSGWRWSFLAENLHVGSRTQWPLLAYIATQVTVISGCSIFWDQWDQWDMSDI